jgi:hypothetical protein
MIARKFVQHPLAIEPPEPAVLLATERACRPVVDTVVIHMGHSRDAIARNPIIGIAGCCARRERRCGRAAKERNELASFHCVVPSRAFQTKG